MRTLYAYCKKRSIIVLSFCAVIFSKSYAQVPVAYYDFEDNSNRNTIVETSLQESISTIGSPVITPVSLTTSHGVGNGTSATYGGANTGYAIGYYGFTTNATSVSTNPAVKFGPFNCSGFSTLTVSMDIIGIGALKPSNVDLYYSLNDVTYTRIVATTAVTTSYTTVTFTIPAAANNQSTVYFKAIGFGAGASPTASDGVMRIDNFTLRSSLFTASKTLIDAAAHGIGLSSGGTYFPAYTSLNINGAGITITAAGNLTLGTIATTTALTLTNGTLDVGNNILTLQTANALIARNGSTQTGKLTIGSAGTLNFGSTGNIGGNAFTIPSNVFTASPVVLKNITVTRTNAITCGNQSFTIDGGTLTLTSGVFSLGANTLTLQNSNTPLARTSGTMTVATTSNISFGSAGNTTGNAFTIPTGFFTASPPSLNNFTVNRTNNLSLGSQGLTINGTLTLESGVLNTGNNALVFQTGATPIVVTTGSLTVGTATNITFGANAAAFTIPNNTFTSTPTFNNLTINRAGGVVLGNQSLTINGSLVLTTGAFTVGSNTLTFQTGNTPISRTSGTLTVNNTSSLRFGTTGNTGGNAYTLVSNVFTTSPAMLNSLSINRTNAFNWGNQSLTIDGGTLNLEAGVFSLGANTLTLQNSNTPLARTSGTMTVATTSNISFGSAGNTGGNAFTIPTGFFTASPPSLNNFTVNRTDSLSLGSQGLTINGTLTLESGVLNAGNNALVFQTGATPIARTTGSLTVGTATNITFGANVAAFTIPNNTFTTTPTFNNLTINRVGGIVLGNQGITLNGTLTLTTGAFNILNNTLTFQTSATPIARTTGTLTVGASSNILFNNRSVAGTTTLPNTIFTSTPATFANLTINPGAGSTFNLSNNAITLSNNLNVNSGTFVINTTTGIITTQADVNVSSATLSITAAINALTVQGNLNLTSGIISTTNAASTITVQGSVLGTGSQTSASVGRIIMTGSSVTLNSGVTYDNVEVNSTGNVSLNGTTTFTGVTTLTAGNLVFGPNTINYTTSTTQIVKTAGFITLDAGTNLVFGAGGAMTIPNTTFNGSTSIASLSIRRAETGTSAVTLNWGTNPINVTGNLEIVSGTSPANTTLNINSATGGITVNGNLNFSSGTATSILTTAGNLTLAGNINLVSGTATQNGAGRIIMTGNPSVASLAGITYSNVQLNSVNNFSLTGSPIFTGTLTLTAGDFAIGSNTITFHTGNTPIVRTSGTMSFSSSSNIVFGITGNTAGNAFTIPNNVFLTAPTINSFTINRTNALTLNNQNITLSGNLNLIAGTLNDAGRTITVNGNITGSATHAGTGSIVMATSYTTISGATLGNLQLNNAGGFSLTGSPIIVGTLTLSTGALSVGANTLTFHTGNTPIARTSGTITLSSTSNLVFGITGSTGGNAFTIPNNTFTSDPEFFDFTINRTNSLTLNNQNFALQGTLTLTSGTLILPANYIFTLRSTSISNTAMVGAVGATAAIQYGTAAAFRVERYIPQQTGSGVRAYRDIATAVNSGTGKIFDNWQEGGTNGLVGGLYYGTHISGVAGASPGGVDATTGFDKTQSGGKSLYTYDINTTTGDGSWITATSSKNTNDTLSAFKGYRILIRGNRLVNLYQAPTPTTMNAAARLRSTGKLVTGDVVFTTTGVTANGATNTGIRLNSASTTGYTMIGNPYASIIDWDLLYADASTTNISATYTTFDPNVGATGSYATYNKITGITVPSSSAVNKYIQPGQAFFIQNTSTSPSITIKETHKITNKSFLNTVFRNTNQTNTNSNTISRIYVNIQKPVNGNYTTMDGVAAAFDSSFSYSIGEEDGAKVSNGSENICVLSNSKQLSIVGQPHPTMQDSIQLNIWQTTAGINYKLEINATYFDNKGLNVYLVDKFTNTQTTLSLAGITTYNFTTTTNAASYNNRFAIVFAPASVLPISFIKVEASQFNTGVNIDWKTYEADVDYYEIEKNISGNNFTTVGTVSSKGLTNLSTQEYLWFDANPNKGTNLYRIKCVTKNREVVYSNVVSIKLNVLGNSISVYPNPVKGNKLTLHLQNIQEDVLSINLYSLSGQLVMSKTMQHIGGTATKTIELPSSISAGVYNLKIIGDRYSDKQTIILE